MSGDVAIARPDDTSGTPGESEPGGAIVVSTAVRGLRSELRQLAWMVLEELALDAVLQSGRLVARTSARRIEDRLAVDPGTVAGALRSLRDRGLVALEREAGPAGRFGLAVYVLGNVDGLTVVAPWGPDPDVADPCAGLRCVARPGTAIAGTAQADGVKPATAPPVVNPRKLTGQRRRASGGASPVLADQAELDLGLGTA